MYFLKMIELGECVDKMVEGLLCDKIGGFIVDFGHECVEERVSFSLK